MKRNYGQATVPKTILCLLLTLSLLMIVFGCSGGSDSNPSDVKVKPAVTSVSPALGITTGGTSVTLTGSGFQANATVTFGGSAATNVTVSGSTSITLTTPAHAAGAVDIVVTNPNNEGVTVTNGFAYVAPTVVLTVTNVSPNSGTVQGGTAVTITGTGFVAVPTVTFGGTAATSVSITSTTSLTATTPASAPGAKDVVVMNPGGETVTVSNGFTFVPLAVTSISPAVGTTNGGMSVTFVGTGFQAGATVTFGNVAATNVSVANSTSLTATTPAHGAGQVNVVVTNPNTESVTITNGFVYVLPALSVTSIDPNVGSTYGGFAVITGDGFVNPSVTFGGTPGTVLTVGSTSSFSCEYPPHTAGPVDVVVTISGGASYTYTNGFTYVAPVQLQKQNWQIDLTYLGGDFRVGADMIQNGNTLTGDYFYASGGTNFQVLTSGSIQGDSLFVTFILDQGTVKEASFTCTGKLFSSSPQVFRGNFTSNDEGPICGGVSPCQGSFEIK